MMTSTTDSADQTPRRAPESSPQMPARRALSLLLLILLIGGYFRTLNLVGWDGNSFLHPDERFMIYTVYSLSVPSSLDDYWRSSCVVNGEVPNPKRRIDLYGRALPPEQWEPSAASGCNSLNPRNYNWARMFVYGTLPTSLARAVLEFSFERFPQFFGEEITPQDARVVGRILSVLFDIGSIVLVFLIGAALYDRRVGLLGALFLALAALPIQLAHFFTVDSATAFFTLLSIFWAARIARGGGFFSFTMLGLSIGAAMACRITMATLGLAGMLAVLIRMIERERHDAAFEERPFSVWNMLLAGRSFALVAGLSFAGMLSLFSFRIFQPDAFVGSTFFDIRLEPRFLSNIATVGQIVSGVIDSPPSQQWALRTPYLFPLQNIILWGMGLPLGLTAWLAWAAAGWQLLRRHDLRHLIPFGWIAFYFAWQGGQFGMTMRYYALLYGLLCILAAWALLALWKRTPARGSWAALPRTAVVWRLPMLVVVLGAFAWAFAFTRIYTAPHSRIEASRWIYQNIPPGSAITHEIWDDPLPLAVDGQSPAIYRGISMSPYMEDDAIKYTGYVAADGRAVPGLLEQLDQADYIILSSNRVYDSATRLPMRYPALTRYYHALFSGELGFELVADIHSYPTLFGFQIPTLFADEAFSVYDHPRVLIFRKTADYSRALATDLITGDVAWGEVYKLATLRVNKTPTALRLTEAQWPAFREAGTWAQLFTGGLSGITNAAPWLFWLLALELIGLAMFAILFRVLPGLPDRGFALAKTLGLLLVSWMAWLLASLGSEDGRPWMSFTPASVWLCTGMLVAVGALIGWRNRSELGAFLRERRTALISAQVLFLLVFVGFLALRLLNPDLWHPARGGEKPMNLAFLTAVIKSSAFPPYDPWFAGGFINYYYFGHVLIGTLIQLTGIVPATAFNLAIPTISALTALGAWGAAYNLLARGTESAAHTPPAPSRTPIMAGVLAALFVTLAGNLAQPLWFAPGTANPADPIQPAALQLGPLSIPGSYAAQQLLRGRAEWAFWDATRTVGMAVGDSTITEFPFFTFLFGDLHAHSVALILTTAALILMIALVRSATASLLRLAAPLFLLALTVGALRATNTWDFPTFAGLGVLTFGLMAFGRAAQAGWKRALIEWAVLALMLLALSSLLFWPFLRSFATDYAGFDLWRGAHTPALEFLKVYGLWVALLLGATLALLHRMNGFSWLDTLLMGVGLPLVILMAVILRLDARVIQIALIVASMAVLASVLLWDTVRRQTRLILALPVVWVLAAFGLTFMVELLVARGDIGRMNTVFKFGLQSWTLLGVVAGIGLAWSWQHIPTWRSAPRRVWIGLSGILLALGLVYPITATPARLADRFDRTLPATLDGTAFMRSPASTWSENGRSFALADDAAAITWMQQNIQGTPIMLEAQSEGYRWAGRVAIYTGLPTLLGWPWHETQQRSVAQAQPIIANRQALIQQLYTTATPAERLATLQLYGVEYVVVGALERALYGTEASAGFDTLMAQQQATLVYDGGTTQIYQIPPADHQPAVLTTSLPVRAPTLPPQMHAMLDVRVGDLPDSNTPGWNAAARNQPLAVVIWLLAWYLIGLLGLPVAVLVFGPRHGAWSDAGYIWARPIGLMLLGYAVWLPVSARLWQFDAVGLALGVMLVLALNLAVLVWMGSRNPPPGDPSALLVGLRVVWQMLRTNGRRILLGELAFLGAFAFLLVQRALNPDLWQPIWGGEKPFNFGFLNALMRTPVIPPYNPFFSDGTINYYYYGFFLIALPLRLTGIPPEIGYNLAVPLIFALMFSGAFALVARLTGRATYGLLGALLVTMIGNLATIVPVSWEGYTWSRGLLPVFDALRAGAANAPLLLGDWFVGPTRVMPYTINEFPFFTFLFADLHAHAIALPFTLLAVALAFRIVGTPARPEEEAHRPALLLLAMMTLGTLAVTNSWDFPTYGLLIGVALLARAWRAPGSLGQRLGAVVQASLVAVLIGTGALVLFLSFFQNYRPMVSGIMPVAEATNAGYYFLAYGLFLLALIPFVFATAWRVLVIDARQAHRQPGAAPTGTLRLAFPMRDPTWLPGMLQVGLVAALVLVLVIALLQPLLLLLGALPNMPELPPLVHVVEEVLGTRLWLALLFVIGAGLLFLRRLRPATWLIICMATLAWAVSLGWELIAIADHLQTGDYYRMNTVFKFGMQVWVLLALATAAALPMIERGLSRAGFLAEVTGRGVFGALLIITLLYPLIAIPNRAAYRFPDPPAPTLDGLKFLETADYSWNGIMINLADDARAIAWLNENLRGTPVVLHSSLEFYRAYGVRIAANTGFPNIVSPLHESEQRDPQVVAARDRDVRTLYTSPDTQETLRLLSRYRVAYVYVGPIERAAYGEIGIRKFESMTDALMPIYNSGSVTIYRVAEEVWSLPMLPLRADAPGQSGQPSEATLLRQIELDPQALEPVVELARRYRLQGRLDEAAGLVQGALTAHPRDAFLYHLHGDILRDDGRRTEAEQAYRNAAAVAPSAANYAKLGIELYTWELYLQAEEALMQSLAIDPNAPEPALYLARIYDSQNQTDLAITYYTRYLNLAPADGRGRAEANEAILRLRGSP